MGLPDTLKHNLRRRREQLRLTQAQLAQRATERGGSPVHISDISRWESGKRRPSMERIEALAAALVCEPADLMAGPLPPLPEGF
mgnify:CR=1 FL=1